MTPDRTGPDGTGLGKTGPAGGRTGRRASRTSEQQDIRAAKAQTPTVSKNRVNSQVNSRVYQQLLELKRLGRPCILDLPETLIAAQKIQRVDEPSASMPSAPVPSARVVGTDGRKRDVPLRLIESIDVPE